jgi:hypothetical protein
MYSEVEAREIIALMQALRVVTVSENVLADHVQATFKHYESICSRDDYETTCGRERLEVERQHGTVVAERLNKFDTRHAADREKTIWSWHPLYYMCTTNRRLEERLPPLPWSHSADEAINVRKALSYERTPVLTKPAEACFLRLFMVANGIHFRCRCTVLSHLKYVSIELAWSNVHVPHPLTPSRRPLYRAADPIDRATAPNINEWASSGTGFDASVRLVLKTGSALFGNCVSIGGASLEELNAAHNRLVVGDLDKLHDWFSRLHARVVEDFAIINETAFLNAWMDVRGEDGTWLPVLQDVLQMWENLDLGWIPPGTYPSLREDYSIGGSGVLKFLNRVIGDRWSCVETIVDGKTRESPDARPLETQPEDDGIREEAPGTDDALLPEAPATETDETASGDTPKLWMQQMKEGFLEIPEGDSLPSTSQFDYTGLSQSLPSTPAHSPITSESSADSSPKHIDMARDRDGHVPTVSQVPEIDPAPATVVPTAPALSEAEIAALVAMRLRRYLQVMV